MRTTTMQLAHLTHEVEHNRNHYFQVSLPKKSGIGNQLHYRPHRTLLVLVDFSKAFDSIDHRVLSRLLANIPGVDCRRWLRNFLCGRYAKTRVGHRHSDRRPMLRRVPQGSVLGPYLFSLYAHPLLSLLNSFAGATADMYADDLSIIVRGQSREDAIPTANMVLKRLHAWSQENGLAINPSKREAAWFTLSMHTESDYDREGRWPLVVAGCQIPVMTMGASRTTKLLGIDIDPRLTLNVAATKQCAATSQRISQLRCIAHKEAGPSPHDLRTFVIGHGAPNYAMAASSYGQWRRIQRRMRCRRRTQLWHALSAGFRALSTRNPHCWRLICRRSTSFACARGSQYLRTHAHVRWTGCGDPRLSHRLALVSASRHYLGTSYMPL
ncbi:putative Reverse transcriptase (RNA-dependent DNA polymerase)/RNase H [Trypanosoma cruzi]|uniref:Putative Reverse transcriptase (RNA-dependent DNA polymerase)/RNase H n=1 Tax=Trypanosoma cruzi TaxID=5693 RepID=A0A2V2XJE0_TRYCR|nr:putative Reverse transcriptase (RNA-dependent DNA polymerase)/RNase H [Trypanosoma cruzi]